MKKKESDSDLRKNEYYYESAGIRERSGNIPLWLILVALGLLVWGTYYLAVYWNPPLPYVSP